MIKKEQIEELYIDALNNDEAPNVFADQILFLFGVVQQSELLLCKHCDNKKALHSESTGLCPDRFKHFKAK